MCAHVLQRNSKHHTSCFVTLRRHLIFQLCDPVTLWLILHDSIRFLFSLSSSLFR